MVINGYTSTGFEYQIDTELMNDWRFVDALTEMDDKDQMTQAKAAKKMINLILGDGGLKRLRKHVRREDGREPIDEMMAIVQEIVANIETVANKAKDETLKN